MRPTQTIGFLLWRTGLLILGSYALWRGSNWVLRYVDLPPELEVGLGLVATGCGLVLGSLIAERMTDVRGEPDWR